MKFEEMKDEPTYGIKNVCMELHLGDPEDIDAFHKYWMDVADPRGKYLAEREDYLMSGGNYY